MCASVPERVCKTEANVNKLFDSVIRLSGISILSVRGIKGHEITATNVLFTKFTASSLINWTAFGTDFKTFNYITATHLLLQ